MVLFVKERDTEHASILPETSENWSQFALKSLPTSPQQSAQMTFEKGTTPTRGEWAKGQVWNLPCFYNQYSSPEQKWKEAHTCTKPHFKTDIVIAGTAQPTLASALPGFIFISNCSSQVCLFFFSFLSK